MSKKLGREVYVQYREGFGNIHTHSRQIEHEEFRSGRSKDKGVEDGGHKSKRHRKKQQHYTQTTYYAPTQYLEMFPESIFLFQYSTERGL